MEILRSGSSGEAVEALQKRLLGQGVNPGPVDGIFGHKTEDAVKRFQGREGLEADGIAGPKTFAALGMIEAEAPEEKGSLSDLAAEIEAKKGKGLGRSGGERFV